MTSSNLARRLEEYDARIETLRLIQPPPSRQVTEPSRPRRKRAVKLEVRDQGLRQFRVC